MSLAWEGDGDGESLVADTDTVLLFHYFIELYKRRRSIKVQIRKNHRAKKQDEFLQSMLSVDNQTAHELRKKPLTFTFIWRLIWGACAKGKCWFAKARESKSAPRKPRKLTCVDMCIRDLVLQICERFAKDVRKVRESWGVQVQEFPLFARSGLIGKCKAFLWKC